MAGQRGRLIKTLVAAVALGLIAPPASAERGQTTPGRAEAVPTDTYVLMARFGNRKGFGPSSSFTFQLESAEPECVGRRSLEMTVHPGDGSADYRFDRAVSSRLGFIHAFNYPDSRARFMRSAEITLMPSVRMIDGAAVTCEGSTWTLNNPEVPPSPTRREEQPLPSPSPKRARVADPYRLAPTIGPGRPECEVDRVATLTRRADHGDRRFYVDRGYTGEHGGYGLLIPNPKQGARYVVDVPAKRAATGGIRVCPAVHFSFIYR